MTEVVDALIVGAGFAGLRALYTLREQGLRATVLEASADVGGVWYHNQYPGARCDVESYDYSYSFSPALEQEWCWTERYATQPEILKYINHVAERFDLRRDIRFNTRMASATYDADRARWHVVAADGREWHAQYLIMAVGQLSSPKPTTYPGQDQFAGRIIYSAQWPHEHIDFTGKSVAIIGTGSSGVQMTPVIARQARRLTVFQRTANYSIPAANAPVTQDEDRTVKSNYAERRQRARNSPSGLGFVPNSQSALDVPEDDRVRTFEAAWNRLGFGFALAYKDILLNQESNDTAVAFIHAKIAELVPDPVLREKLTPQGFPFASRRPSVDSGFYQTFSRDNVELVDIRATPIEAITPDAIRTSAKDYPVDILIYATGFDAFTGSLLKPQITGRDGTTLQASWSAGPRTYLGLGVAQFPNLFIICGPGSPSLLSNVLLSTEEQVDWLASLISHCAQNGLNEIEVTDTAQADWVVHVNERSLETLYPKAQSYYMGAEMPGKPQVFMPYSGGVRGYRRILQDVAKRDYAGFVLRQV